MKEGRALSYVIVDVFADRPFEGNQLAVFLDGRGLATEQMQTLAREMNLSETTFIMPDANGAEGTRVRIFTVDEELPFAGHPTLGTAYCLHSRTHSEKIVLNLNVGAIPVTFSAEAGKSFGEMTQRDPEFGETYSREELARVVGLSVNDISADLPIQTVSTGMPFAIVPIQSLEAIRRMCVTWAGIAEFLKGRQAKFFYLVTRETLDPNSALHARMIFYGGEDPATGSAAGCCTGWAVAHGVLASEQRGIIEQGFEIRRPSRIHVRGSLWQGTVSNVRVGGHCVEVARGEFVFPN